MGINRMNKHRLSKNVFPEKYEISLDVNLDNFTYSGNQIIDIEINKKTKRIQLNAAELTIDKCFIQNKDKKRLEADVVYEKEIECITFIFPKEIDSGKWKLEIAFHGKIRADLRGFYKSKFVDDKGNEKWLGTTQFEPTAARYAFPCWD